MKYLENLKGLCAYLISIMMLDPNLAVVITHLMNEIFIQKFNRYRKSFLTMDISPKQHSKHLNLSKRKFKKFQAYPAIWVSSS